MKGNQITEDETGETCSTHETEKSCIQNFGTKTWYLTTEVAGLAVALLTYTGESCISWDIRPCNRLKIYRCFGGKYHLHLQGRRINLKINQREAGSKVFGSCSVQISVSTQAILTEVYLDQATTTSFKFTIHQSSYHQTRYILDTYNVVK
jgi:hypothetical protein